MLLFVFLVVLFGLSQCVVIRAHCTHVFCFVLNAKKRKGELRREGGLYKMESASAYIKYMLYMNHTAEAQSAMNFIYLPLYSGIFSFYSLSLLPSIRCFLCLFPLLFIFISPPLPPHSLVFSCTVFLTCSALSLALSLPLSLLFPFSLGCLSPP